MTPGATVDGVLVTWGERLFYPRTRSVKPAPTPRLDTLTRRKAVVIRQRIEATVVRRAPQVMVNFTGSGRGMAAIAAHLRYISKGGRLEIEDDRGVVREGREGLREVVDPWRHGGSLIDEVGHRREAFNIMLSMPQGTDAQAVLKAAREFAQAGLQGHRYVMVLHTHQANPHVHLSVRAESMRGERLNPRKNDLHRWRETFADKLRGLGIEAEATRQTTRGVIRSADPLWRLRARDEGRLRHDPRPGRLHRPSHIGAVQAWVHIVDALGASERAEDRQLAADIRRFMSGSPLIQAHARLKQRQAMEAKRSRQDPSKVQGVSIRRIGPDIER